MKYKIENLQDITDSREVMQSNPKCFSKYMTYIILALLSIVIIWSIFAKKEVVVHASGVVIPRGNTDSITSSIQGNITSINVKDGDEVHSGDVLLTVNGSEYVVQQKALKESIDKDNNELEAMKLLRNSVLDNTNHLDSNDENQKQYYKKYQLYLENLNSNATQEDAVNQQKTDINNTINKLNLLKGAIQNNSNCFSEGDSYYYQYKDYELAIQKYDATIQNYRDEINKLNKNITSENRDAVSQSINSNNQAINSTELEKITYKNTTLSSITNSISEYNSKLSQLTVSSAKNSYKEQYIATLDQSITAMESSVSDNELNLKSVNEKVDSTSIKASCDGIVSFSDLKYGDYVQLGTQLGEIIPEDISDLDVQLYIKTSDFGEIKENQEVAIEVLSLPGSQYGYIRTSLEDISINAITDKESGTSYYTAKCQLPDNYLLNKHDEEIDLKNGMTTDVKIINRKVSYFRYFLEKINILD